MRLVTAAIVLAATLGAAACRAECPTATGPLPSGFAYSVDGGRHSAEAVALLPLPVSRVAPIAEAVKAEPTWTNLEAKGSVPGPVRLQPLLQQNKLKDPKLEIDAVADAQCAGATRVTARFSWSFGALARALGGDAKDIPALLAIAVRDEVIARVLTTPEEASRRVGAAPSPDMELLRVAPQGLDVPAGDLATLLPRLQALETSKGADLGDVLGVYFDIQRKATAIAGFGALSRKGATPTLVNGPCESCDIGYEITVAQTPDGKGGAISFGLKRYR